MVRERVRVRAGARVCFTLHTCEREASVNRRLSGLTSLCATWVGVV